MMAVYYNDPANIERFNTSYCCPQSLGMLVSLSLVSDKVF